MGKLIITRLTTHEKGRLASLCGGMTKIKRFSAAEPNPSKKWKRENTEKKLHTKSLTSLLHSFIHEREPGLCLMMMVHVFGEENIMVKKGRRREGEPVCSCVSRSSLVAPRQTEKNKHPLKKK